MRHRCAAIDTGVTCKILVREVSQIVSSRRPCIAVRPRAVRVASSVSLTHCCLPKQMQIHIPAAMRGHAVHIKKSVNPPCAPQSPSTCTQPLSRKPSLSDAPTFFRCRNNMNHSAIDLRSRSSLPHPARRFASDERRPLLLPWIGWTPWLLLDRGVPEEVE